MSKKERVKRPFGNIDDILGEPDNDSSELGDIGKAFDQAIEAGGRKRDQGAATESLSISKEQIHAVQIPLFRLKENWSIQPRLAINESHVERLAQQFSNSGQLTSILVRPLDNSGSEYEIIGGHHRYRAALQLGWTTIRCDIRTVSLEEAQILALEDNDANLPTSDYEKGRMYARVMESNGISQGELARRLGLSRPRISQCLVFLELPDAILEVIGSNSALLTYRHATQLRDLFKTEGTSDELIELVNQGLERIIKGSPASGLLSWIKLKLASKQRDIKPKIKSQRSITDCSGRTAFTLRSQGASTLSISWNDYHDISVQDVEQVLLKSLQEFVEQTSRPQKNSSEAHSDNNK